MVLLAVLGIIGALAVTAFLAVLNVFNPVVVKLVLRCCSWVQNKYIRRLQTMYVGSMVCWLKFYYVEYHLNGASEYSNNKKPQEKHGCAILPICCAALKRDLERLSAQLPQPTTPKDGQTTICPCCVAAAASPVADLCYCTTAALNMALNPTYYITRPGLHLMVKSGLLDVVEESGLMAAIAAACTGLSTWLSMFNDLGCSDVEYLFKQRTEKAAELIHLLFDLLYSLAMLPLDDEFVTGQMMTTIEPAASLAVSLLQICSTAAAHGTEAQELPAKWRTAVLSAVVYIFAVAKALVGTADKAMGDMRTAAKLQQLISQGSVQQLGLLALATITARRYKQYTARKAIKKAADRSSIPPHHIALLKDLYVPWLSDVIAASDSMADVLADMIGETHIATSLACQVLLQQLAQQQQQGRGQQQWWEGNNNKHLASLHKDVFLVLVELLLLPGDGLPVAEVLIAMWFMIEKMQETNPDAAKALTAVLAKPMLQQVAPLVLQRAEAQQRANNKSDASSSSSSSSASSCELALWALVLIGHLQRLDSIADAHHVRTALLQHSNSITAVEAGFRAAALLLMDPNTTLRHVLPNHQPWSFVHPALSSLAPLVVPALANDAAAAVAAAAAGLAPAGSHGRQPQACSLLFSALKIVGSSNSHIAGREGGCIRTFNYWLPYKMSLVIGQLASEAVYGLRQHQHGGTDAGRFNVAAAAASAKRISDLQEMLGYSNIRLNLLGPGMTGPPAAAATRTAGTRSSSSSSSSNSHNGTKNDCSSEVTAWLAVVARSVYAVARGLEKVTHQSNHQAPAVAAATGATSAGSVRVECHVLYLCMFMLEAAEIIKLLCAEVPKIAAAATSRHAPSAVATAMAQLQRSGEQVLQVMEEVKLEAEAAYTFRNTVPSPNQWEVDMPAGFLQQLQQFVMTASSELVPLHCCCANPACEVLSGFREVDLVAGSSTVCSGCKAVRYCCSECQLQHWKAAGGHRKVCKRFQSVAASGAAAATKGKRK